MEEKYDADDRGVDERDVRLDAVLAEPGDRLVYLYDYGDDWRHALKLEAVRPRRDGEPAAACIGGRRACPPEDCGGIDGYESLVEAGGDFAVAYGYDLPDGEVGLPRFDSEAFDVREANAVLAGIEPTPTASGLPRAVTALLRKVGGEEVSEALSAIVDEARLEAAVLPDVDVGRR